MTTTYRWNTSDFAVGYDAAAETIHPHYRAIQDEILGLLDGSLMDGGLVIDLGGGSGRLMERILDRWPSIHGIVIDQSEPFLALAERRLDKFGDRAHCLQSRLQSDWPSQLPGQATAFVSMSAIHHLEPVEKASLYGCCFESLAPGGVLLNGDEIRAANETEYYAELSRWAEGMRRGMASGTVPAIFHDALHAWIDRNVTRFKEPKKSGDDCHETIAAQLEYFRLAGFKAADCPWQSELWAILRGVKMSAVLMRCN